MGPSISSFAVIAFVMASGEEIMNLALVFIAGIMLKILGRKTKDRFMKEVNQRKVK